MVNIAVVFTVVDAEALCTNGSVGEVTLTVLFSKVPLGADELTVPLINRMMV